MAPSALVETASQEKGAERASAVGRGCPFDASLRRRRTGRLAPQEMADLEQEAQRLQQRNYESSDRKYHSARAMANRDSKSDYAQGVSRRRPPKA